MTELLTHTKRRDYRTCPRYFYNRHERRLELRVQRAGRRRGHAFGAAVFAAQQAVEAGVPPEELRSTIEASVEDSYDEAFNQVSGQEDVRTLEIEMAKVKVMADLYVARYGTDRRREVVFDFPLRNPKTGHPMRSFRRGGKIDGLIFYQDRKVDLIEDKFTSQITRVMIERLPLDEQILEYADALAEHGYTCRVLYRHTRFPGINPEKAKQYKTKEDKPEETIEQFMERLRQDAAERPDFYFDEQQLILDSTLLEEHRLERWVTAHDILAKRRLFKQIGEAAWNKSTSRCLEFGGCPFLALCEGQQDAMDRYVVVPDNQELIEEEHDGEE